MNWENEGYLLSKIKFRENANIKCFYKKLWESKWHSLWRKFKKVRTIYR